MYAISGRFGLVLDQMLFKLMERRVVRLLQNSQNWTFIQCFTVMPIKMFNLNGQVVLGIDHRSHIVAASAHNTLFHMYSWDVTSLGITIIRAPTPCTGPGITLRWGVA